MFEELENYGWVVPHRRPFEYSSDFECVWVDLVNAAFPEIHIAIEIKFYGLKTKAILEVVDENIDGADDSYEVLSQTEFDPDEIWEACERIIRRREKGYRYER